MEATPRKRMRRRGAPGEARFMTCSCLGGRRFLQSRIACRAVVDGLGVLVRSDAISVHAWVIMSNHLHLLLTPRVGGIEDPIARLKSDVARAIGAELGSPAKVWEPGGGFDRVVWSGRAYWSVTDYIHFNPVKAGLVARPEQWQWSSARDWIRQRRSAPLVSHPMWLA